MNALDFLKAANAAGINPLRDVPAPHADGTVRLIPADKVGKHDFSMRDRPQGVVMVQLQAAWADVPAGTHDGLRDGNGSAKLNGCRRVYYDARDVSALLTQ